MSQIPSYVVITPARNEAQFIELTIKSMLAQTVRPLKWIIVSDGSTDGTDEIVTKHSAENPWIELIRMPERRERNFAGKVFAFNAGYERVKNLQFDCLGCVDGDASFEESYFEFLLERMAEDPRLGLAGTAFREASSQNYDYRFVSIEHVTGICQLFRRRCFDEIGGYVPAKGGAIDRIANIAVRMKGWKTRTFPERTYFHHRQMGTAQQSLLMARFKDGAKDYAVGSHPVWELFRTLYQMSRKPLVIGGLAVLWGYLWSAFSHMPRPVPDDMVAFHRDEQMQRLRNFLAGKTLVHARQQTAVRRS
jgi:glycosyltransferase involved in cell wall biosynthesis